MSDVFGVRIAGATLEGMSRACAARLREWDYRKFRVLGGTERKKEPY